MHDLQISATLAAPTPLAPQAPQTSHRGVTCARARAAWASASEERPSD